MSTVVIDASALLAFILGETGAKVVEKDVRTATISAINLGEAAQRQFAHGTTPKLFDELVDHLGLDIVPVDRTLAMDAAQIREIGRKRGLSQADCICLALAKRLNVTALTADRAWAEIADEVGVVVRVIR